MQPNGRAAFDNRDEKLTNRYSFEREAVELDKKYEKEFKRNRKAWDFFQSQPPSYRKPAIWWIMSARQEETRLQRLDTLIKDSEAGERVGPLRRPSKK